MLNLQLTTPQLRERTYHYHSMYGSRFWGGNQHAKYLPDSSIPHHSLIRVMWCMDTCKGKQPMQLVHLHPDLEKQRSLQRKLTEWWSQLNAKASLKRLVSLQSPPHWLSYDELPKSEVTSPKIFHAVSSFTSRFQETKVIAKEAHWMMIATKRKRIPW